MGFKEQDEENIDVNTVVKESMRKLRLGIAGVLLFSSFLNAGFKFPFEAFEVNANTGGERKVDIKGEINAEVGDTENSTAGNTTIKKYMVIVPTNRWNIIITSA